MLCWYPSEQIVVLLPLGVIPTHEAAVPLPRPLPPQSHHAGGHRGNHVGPLYQISFQIIFQNFQKYFPPGMGKGSRPQRILWRSIWANYFPTLIPFHFLCEGNNFTLLPTSLSTNMCDRRILVFLLKKIRQLFRWSCSTNCTDWVTISSLRQRIQIQKKRILQQHLQIIRLTNIDI